VAGSEGIGLAIPTDLAREVMVSLVKDGKVTAAISASIFSPLRLPWPRSSL